MTDVADIDESLEEVSSLKSDYRKFLTIIPTDHQEEEDIKMSSGGDIDDMFAFRGSSPSSPAATDVSMRRNGQFH